MEGGREERGLAWLQEATKLSHRHPSPGSIPAPVVNSQRRPSPHLVNPLSLRSRSGARIPARPPGALGKQDPVLTAPSPSASLHSSTGRDGRRRGNVRFLN